MIQQVVAKFFEPFFLVNGLPAFSFMYVLYMLFYAMYFIHYTEHGAVWCSFHLNFLCHTFFITILYMKHKNNTTVGSFEYCARKSLKRRIQLNVQCIKTWDLVLCFFDVKRWLFSWIDRTIIRIEIDKMKHWASASSVNDCGIFIQFFFAMWMQRIIFLIRKLSFISLFGTTVKCAFFRSRIYLNLKLCRHVQR